MAKKKLTISVIMPSYNEQATIIEILTRVRAQKVAACKFEVIVVDDGSSDKTVELLEQNPELYDQLIKMPQNGGKGAAVKAGLKSATGDYILFQDADLEYDPAEYANLLTPVLKFNADIVMGSRFLAPKYTRVAYFWNKVGNRFITFVFNILNNTTFTDIYSCYLLYRRSLVHGESLTTVGWEQHAEILSRAVAGAGNMYDVPISYHGRTVEEGKKIRAHHVIAVIKTIIVQRFSK